MRPDLALEGTLTSRPRLVWRSLAPGGRLLIRAPALAGKATTMPGRRPTPSRASRPRIETWRGLPLHFTDGTHLALVMRTLRTCRLALPVAPPPLDALLVPLAPPPAEGDAVPPAPAAPAPGASASKEPATAAIKDAHRLCARVLATTIPSRRTDSCQRRGTRALRLGEGRPYWLWRSNLATPPKLRSRLGQLEPRPSGSSRQRKPDGAGAAASGLDGSPGAGCGRLKPVGATSLGASA